MRRMVTAFTPPPPPTKRPVTQENGQVKMDVTRAGYFTGVGMQCHSALSQSIYL